jgi:hypothetical protein
MGSKLRLYMSIGMGDVRARNPAKAACSRPVKLPELALAMEGSEADVDLSDSHKTP